MSPAQTITVTDPRHPFYGRTLPLIKCINHTVLGRCYVVWSQPGIESLIPVNVTASEFRADQISPTPLSISAVEDLVRVFQYIQCTYLGDNSHDHSAESNGSVS